MFSGLIGSIVGGVSSVANSAFSSWLGNRQSKKALARNYDYHLRSLRESPLEQRKGLEAAGYNPMLALGNVGSSSFSANSAASFAPMGNFDLLGSAKEGARLVNDLTKGIKLENEKKELENQNLLSDLDTKEVQRLQMEANQSLLESQAERSDLAYGRDIADTITSVAGTGAQLYSAKAMADVAKSNAAVNARNATVNERRLDSHTSEIRRNAKGKVVGSVERQSFSHGVPAVDSSAKGSRPSVAPHVGSSAKSAGRAVKSVAKRILEDPLLLPLVLTGAAVSEYATPEGRKRQGDHYRRNWENNKYYSPLR